MLVKQAWLTLADTTNGLRHGKQFGVLTREERVTIIIVGFVSTFKDDQQTLQC